MTGGRRRDRQSQPPGRPGDAAPDGEDSFTDWADDAGEVDRLSLDTRRGPYRPKKTIPPGRGATGTRPPAESMQFPNPDEPLLARRPHLSKNQFSRLCAGKIRPERRLDLHGHQRDSARRMLITTLEAAGSSGIECVLVIHGQGHRSATGEAVLRQAMPEWLASPNLRHLVLAFSPAQPRDGGSGAVYVLLG